MLDGREPCRHRDDDHSGPAISVDAIDTAGVFTGRFASSIPLFPQFNEISELGSIPASSTKTCCRSDGKRPEHNVRRWCRRRTRFLLCGVVT